MLFSLSNKQVLVTGATSGIGRATALICAKQGARVLCVGRNEDRMNSLIAELNKVSSLSHQPYLMDLNDINNIQDLVAELPKVDGVVFAAGINKWKPIPFIKKEEMYEVVDINLMAPVCLLKELCKQKKMNIGSSIVFVSSVAGVYTSSIGNGMYAASKAALQAYMKTAALELSPKKIRCNCVNPGRILTELVTKNLQMSDDEVLADIERYPLKRYGTPEDVANAIIFLLSDETAWITGTDIVIDGGLTLK